MAPISPLQVRARDAAEALYSDASCRWFLLSDTFLVYNYLYDYYHGRPDDVRLRGLALAALTRLKEFARRLEANAVVPLPPEWDQAKVALSEACAALEEITQSW